MTTGERQSSRIRNMYLKTILRQEIAFFDMETNTGEVIERMSGDTVFIQDAMGEKVTASSLLTSVSHDYYLWHINHLFDAVQHSSVGASSYLLITPCHASLLVVGWQVHPATIHILWGLHSCICPRLASHSCHAQCHPPLGGCGRSRGQCCGQDGIEGTGSLWRSC